MSTTNVPVGVSSVAGYTVTVSTFAAAVVAYLSGDHSQDNLIVIALGVFSAVSFVVTQVGRYAQANAQAKTPVVVPAPANPFSLAERLRQGVAIRDTPPPDDDLDPDPPSGPDPSAARAALDKTS